MTVDGEDLRKVMRHWISGVVIVTADDGTRMDGLTVSSFTSVTLEPPLILICINKEWPTHDTIQRAGSFSVSYLGKEQEAECWNFASEDPDTRFDEITYTRSPAGHPIPSGCLATMDCKVDSAQTAGTHTVFVAEVTHIEDLSEGQPLIYFNQGFHNLAE